MVDVAVVTAIELMADSEVPEGIYSRARIEELDSKCLWLGANVVLEYTGAEVRLLRIFSFSSTAVPVFRIRAQNCSF
ncbi:hypothetical protein C5167_035373 [Papaver somniferum]|uniref:Uncharacterized protein n=1 Tax=Papaver somniferum TaxID=3469 RepID=A0A4Y7KH73_PAPSO|nr:hypothetical protein C5167_035373 [Papaver somniferum]